MGGRGQSSSGGKKTIRLGKKTITLTDGLKYGESQLSGDLRDKIISYEKEIRNKKDEEAFVVDSDGRFIDYKQGEGQTVSGLKTSYDGCVMTHNHPYNSADGYYSLSGTFSSGDLRKFNYIGEKGAKTFRATGFEGTYSITKTNKYKDGKMNNVINKVREMESKINSTVEKIQSETWSKSSGMGWGTWHKDKNARSIKAQNDGMVKIHNYLLRNAKSLGKIHGEMITTKRYVKKSFDNGDLVIINNKRR